MSADQDVPASPVFTTAQKAHIVRGGAALTATRILAQALQWATTLVAARLLTPEHFGLMAVASLALTLGDMFVDFGLSQSVIYADKVNESALRQVFTLHLLIATFATGLLIIAAEPIAAHLGKPDFAAVLIFLTIWFMLWPLQAVSRALLERGFKLKEQSMVVVAMTLVQCVSLLLLAHIGYGVWALAISAVLGRIVQTALLMWLAGWRPGLALIDAEVRPLVLYGGTLTLSAFIWYIQANADQAVIAALLDVASLGLYSLSLLLVGLFANKGVTIINQIAFPVYCRVAKEPAQLRRVFLLVVQFMMLAAVPALAGLSLVADDAIVLIFGKQWADAVVPLKFLALGGVFMMLAAMLPPLFNSLGRTDINIKVGLFNAVAMSTGFAVGGTAAGLIGVCGVWLVVTPVIVLATIGWTRKITGISIGDILRPLIPISLATLCMSVAVVMVHRWLPEPDPSTARLVISVLVGGATFVAAMGLLGHRQLRADWSFVREHLK